MSSQPVSDPKVGPLGDWGTLPQHSSGNPLLPEGCEGVSEELSCSASQDALVPPRVTLGSGLSGAGWPCLGGRGCRWAVGKRV